MRVGGTNQEVSDTNRRTSLGTSDQTCDHQSEKKRAHTRFPSASVPIPKELGNLRDIGVKTVKAGVLTLI